MSKENAEEIGSLVGEVIEVDFAGNGGICMSKFIRVKVELKVDNPFWSGFFLDRQPQSDLWIHFKYERIADICYKCGRLGHLKARCSWADHSGKQLNPKEPFGFGPWMKAENMSRRSTRWVEFLHEADQSGDEEEGDEEERGRKWQIESDGSKEHAPGGVRIKVQSDISFLAKVDGSGKCQTNFENSEAHIPSKQLSADKFPGSPTQSQPEIQPKTKTKNILDQPVLFKDSQTFTPMETDQKDGTKLNLAVQSQPCTSSQGKTNSRNTSET
ncbi:hypothetical protein CFP56_014426 [Quercus suber]|uniref:CCHC-type domain-containing protein n=1 Tax=Quercus suber TaxID=58331 RepID=A0AAW0KT64_QUESU